MNIGNIAHTKVNLLVWHLTFVTATDPPISFWVVTGFAGKIVDYCLTDEEYRKVMD